MPRYMVQRTLPDGICVPFGAEPRVIEVNSQQGVTWIHSYVSEDKRSMFCVYDGPNPESVRKTASASDLPIDRITQVRVLDPYSYR
jgi:Protein of unknown function (DUF4242)